MTSYILCSFASGAKMSYPCWRSHLHFSKLHGGVRSVNVQHLNLPSGNKWVFRYFQALGSQRTSFEGHGWYVFSNCHLISICLSPFSSFLLLPPPPVNPTLSLRDLYISLLGWPPLIRPCLVILLLPKWSPGFGSICSANVPSSSKAEIGKSLGRICSEGG